VYVIPDKTPTHTITYHFLPVRVDRPALVKENVGKRKSTEHVRTSRTYRVACSLIKIIM